MVQTDDFRPDLGENLRITVAASQGGRRYMEDRCVVHTERGSKGQLLWTFVGVFDGHGGEHASEYVRRHLLMNILKNRKFENGSDEEILEAIRQGFLVTHEQMRHVYEEWPYTASGYPSTAGTTVSCVFIRNGKLYTGHVGDSAIFLGTLQNGQLHTTPLTIDHKPESAAEQLRIAEAGGETAVKSGVTRVVWKRPQKGFQTTQFRRNVTPLETIPFLSVARSLGDLWSYNEETNTFIVSPEPDLAIHELRRNDFCLVLASDGMTNVLTGEQAVNIVFKEEELLEANEEVNRNHSRCVLRTALQKWRSLRADNVTIATVIFDLLPSAYSPDELIMKPSRFIQTSQLLADRPDAMLRVTRTENIVLATQRTPIIYSGSKDQNFCRVSYRGPGFRTHEEELFEEKRNLVNRIAISDGPTEDSRRTRDENDEDGVEYDDEEEDDGYDPSEEIELGVKLSDEPESSINRPPRPHAPGPPVFPDDDSIYEPDTSCVSFDEPTMRVKAEAVRRLRTPKLNGDGDADRRVTRSASRKSQLTPVKRPNSGGPLIGVNVNPSPDARLLLTPRRSMRLNGGMSTPETRAVHGKLSASRKRVRTASTSSARVSLISRAQTETGVTPVVSNMSLCDTKPPIVVKSAPTTPKKAEKKLKPSKWSLSLLDERRKKADEVTQETADDDDDDEVMREPPSKIRRFYGYMRKFIWGK